MMVNMTYQIAELSILDRIKKLQQRVPYLRRRWHGDIKDKTSFPKEMRIKATIQLLYAHLAEVESVLYE